MAARTRRNAKDPIAAQQGRSRPHPHRDLRDLTDAKTKVTRQTGVLGHLARRTRENARAHGVVVAAHELLRKESLLRAFRADLLAQPPEVRADSYDVALTAIEVMIQREALSRRTPRIKRTPRPSLVAPRSERSDLESGQSSGARAGRPSISPSHGPRRRALRARAWRSAAAEACQRSLRADRTARTPFGPLPRPARRTSAHASRSSGPRRPRRVRPRGSERSQLSAAGVVTPSRRRRLPGPVGTSTACRRGGDRMITEPTDTPCRSAAVQQTHHAEHNHGRAGRATERLLADDTALRHESAVKRDAEFNVSLCDAAQAVMGALCTDGAAAIVTAVIVALAVRRLHGHRPRALPGGGRR